MRFESRPQLYLYLQNGIMVINHRASWGSKEAMLVLERGLVPRTPRTVLLSSLEKDVSFLKAGFLPATHPSTHFCDTNE